MAEDEKFKTPEELGRAVGEKIEALFGGIFDEPAPKTHTAPTGQDTAASRSLATTQPVEAPAKPQPARKPSHPAAIPKPPSTAPAPKPAGSSLSTLLDRIEALALNLEWESKSAGVRELEQRFRDIDRFLPKEGPARNIAGMNCRVLQLFGRPGASPHPMLGKFLQESCSALRQIHDSQGGRIPDRELMTGIVDAYHRIMRDAAQTSGHVVVPGTPADKPAEVNIGTAVASLEEVRKRLARLTAAAAKQGVGLSAADALAGLKALEHTFGEHLARLSSLVAHGQGNVTPQHAVSPDERVKEGLILVDSQKSPIAVLTSFVAAMYPLGKQQAEQFASKSAINLGNRRVPRLPLRRPQPKDGEAPIRPNWLVHLVSGEKEYFLLAERILGYRRAPQNLDPSKDTKVKFGSAVYFLLTGAVFR